MGGCSWTPDHENPAAELHLVIALLTTGPVGISDLIGHTNATLIRRAITADGTLLSPSKPLTAVDSTFLSSKTTLPGMVYASYSANANHVLAWHFVSFKMTTDWGIGARDFYPPLPAASVLVSRRFGGSRCQNKSRALDCVVAGGDAHSVLVAPKSDHSNVTGGTDFAPTVSSVWPACPSGWFLLGEMDKYVAVSPVRFRNTECTRTGVKAELFGLQGETVLVTLIAPGNSAGLGASTILVRNISFDSSGRFVLVEPDRILE